MWHSSRDIPLEEAMSASDLYNYDFLKGISSSLGRLLNDYADTKIENARLRKEQEERRKKLDEDWKKAQKSTADALSLVLNACEEGKLK